MTYILLTLASLGAVYYALLADSSTDFNCVMGLFLTALVSALIDIRESIDKLR